MQQSGSKIDAATARFESNKKRGKKFYQKGLETLERNFKLAEFLKFDDAANFFYRSSISYKICGRWRLAGDSLVKCAEMHRDSKPPMIFEAAVLYTEASEVFAKTDKTESIKCTRLAIMLYCDLARFDIAGRLERKVARVSHQLRHWEEAAAHYRKAANFLAGDQLLDQSDDCIELAAECYVELEQFEKASEMYIILAESSQKSNLRRFNSIPFLLMSVLCHIAMPADPADKEGDGEMIGGFSQIKTGLKKYAAIKQIIKDTQKYDFMWNNSKEAKFLNNIIEARLEYKQHDLADHLYWWNNMKPYTKIQVHLLRTIHLEVQNELDRRTEERHQEQLRLERAKKRKERLAAKKKLMAEMGFTGEVKLDDDLDSETGSQKDAAEIEPAVADGHVDIDGENDMVGSGDEDDEVEEVDDGSGGNSGKDKAPKPERKKRDFRKIKGKKLPK